MIYTVEHNEMMHDVVILDSVETSRAIHILSSAESYVGDVRCYTVARLNRSGEIIFFHSEFGLKNGDYFMPAGHCSSFDDFVLSDFYRKYVGLVFEDAVARAREE